MVAWDKKYKKRNRQLFEEVERGNQNARRFAFGRSKFGSRLGTKSRYGGPSSALGGPLGVTGAGARVSKQKKRKEKAGDVLQAIKA